MIPKLTADQLKDFISQRMRMSHIYQPVMLKTLIDNDGEASVEDVSKALLSYDQSQVEYYSLRTKSMVGKVLVKNGVIEPIKNSNKIVGYRLNVGDLTEPQRTALTALCDHSIEDYISKRGSSIWGHRGPDSGYVSGGIRYQVLKRASYRCELCGAHEDQIALLC